MSAPDLKENTLQLSHPLRGKTIVAAGSAAAAYFTSLVCYPLDTINTWIKLSNRGDCTRSIIRNHIRKDGFKVLFRGSGSVFMHTAVPTFSYYFLYETLNRYSRKVLDRLGMQHYSLLIPGVTAGISESITLLLSVPIDTVMTRMQMNLPQYQYRSLSHGLKQVIKNEGYLRLFRASPLYLCYTVVQTMIFFQIYEYLRVKQMQRQGKTNNQLTVADSVKNSAIATIATCLAMNPLELIIIRYQAVDSSVSRLSVKSIVQNLLLKDGFKGFSRGLMFSIGYGCLHACVSIPMYEELRKRYGYDFAEGQ